MLRTDLPHQRTPQNTPTGFFHFQHQGGMLLIEILVSLLIFSLGITSIVKLQIGAMMAHYDAVQRTNATLLAYDIIERMRANSNNLSGYINVTVGTGATVAPSPTCTSLATACTGAQMATKDVYDWDLALAGASELSSTSANTGGLVSPTGCITSTVTSGSGNYTVAIAYRGHEALSNPTINTCGESTGNYGTNNEFRRIVEISVYIVAD
ncbi:MAG: type IV pilus modification protein PilV [Magnetococcus sp. THC-1_WYH]